MVSRNLGPVPVEFSRGRINRERSETTTRETRVIDGYRTLDRRTDPGPRTGVITNVPITKFLHKSSPVRPRKPQPLFGDIGCMLQS